MVNNNIMRKDNLVLNNILVNRHDKFLNQKEKTKSLHLKLPSSKGITSQPISTKWTNVKLSL